MITVALVALLLASGLPFATAQAPPESAAWSPERVPAEVRAIAVSRDAHVLAAGNAPVTTRDTPGANVDGVTDDVSTAAQSDFRAYHLADGRLFNASVVGDRPAGRTATAASADGSTVAAGGGSSTSGYALSVYTVPDAAQSGARDARWRVTVPGPVEAVALSADGSRAAAIANTESTSAPEGGVGILRVHDATGSQVMEFRGTGRFTSLAMDDRGQYLVVGGRHYEPGHAQYHGVVYLFRYGNSEPLFREHFTPRNASAVTHVEMSADGATFAALTETGTLSVFENDGARTGRPAIVAAPGPNATRTALTMSADGELIAHATGETIHLHRFLGGEAIAPVWNTTLFGETLALDASRDGGVIVAGVDGANGGVYAFAPGSPDPFWRVARGTVPHVAITGDGEWVAYAQGDRVHAARMQSRVFLLYADGPTRGTTTPPETAPTARPDVPLSFNLHVSNEGSRPEDVTLKLPSARDVAFRADRTSFHVLPGERQEVTVNVTPGRLLPGTYAYNVTVETAGGTTSNTTLVFSLAGASDIVVGLTGSQERRVVPGLNDTVLLEVANHGNEAVGVAASVRQASSTDREWPVFLVGERDFTLAPGARTTVGVLVEVPPHAVNGSTNTVTLSLATAGGTVETPVTYRVNPFLGVDVTAAGRTKFVYGAGGSTQFNLTVTNTGSIPAQFAASWETSPTPSDRHWIADVEANPFSLRPGESYTLPVRVFAPQDGEPGDHLSVVVDVASLPVDADLRPAASNLTLYVNLHEPLPEPKAPAQGFPVPAPGGLLVLAAVAAALLVAPTRRGPFTLNGRRDR